MGSLALRQARMADGMVAWRVVPRLEEPLREKLDHLVVLGMKHHEGAGTARQRQNLE